MTKRDFVTATILRKFWSLDLWMAKKSKVGNEASRFSFVYYLKNSLAFTNEQFLFNKFDIVDIILCLTVEKLPEEKQK